MERPKLKLNYTKSELLLEFICFLGLLGIFGLVLVNWTELPETVPTHYGVSGEPDAWGAKSHFWILPCLGLALSILISVVCRFPHAHNFPWNITISNAESLYRLSRRLLLIVKLHIVSVFLYITWTGIQVTKGLQSGLGLWFLIWTVLVPILFIIYFYFTGRKLQA